MAAAAGPQSVDSATAIATLTDRLLTLETQLADMFESGRPMPKAAVVNAVREEIATLKDQLACLMQGLPPHAHAAARASPAAPSAAIATATPSGASAAGNLPLSDLDTLEKARLLLEGVALRKLPESDALSEAEYSVKLATLEAENERLRGKACALLLRQQALEEQADRHGVARGSARRTRSQQQGTLYTLTEAVKSAAAPPGSM